MTGVAIAARRGGAIEAEVRELFGQTVAWFRIAGGPHHGAIGPTEGDTVEELVRLGAELGMPIVGQLDTSGADVGFGVASLHAWGRVARGLGRASGQVPIGLAVVGPALAGPSLLLGLADLVVMSEAAMAYVSGPAAVAEITGTAIDHDALGGVDVHRARTGVASLVVDHAEDAVPTLVRALAYFPHNNLEAPPSRDTDDPEDRDCRVAAAAVPAAASASYDMRVVIGDVVDAGSFLELRSGFAPNMVTGVATIGGHPLGIVANQPCRLAGTIDIDGSQKAARLVQLCDAFNLPVLTLVDTPGFLPGKDLEWRGMIRHGAQLVHAYAAATVPRVCVVLRKAYGGGYITMDCKTLGNDHCVAWPGAEIAVMGASGAVQILHGKRSLTPEARVALEEEYSARHCTAVVAAERGYIDEVIPAADTRRVIAAALHVLRSKSAPGIRRKHSNPPL